MTTSSLAARLQHVRLGDLVDIPNVGQLTSRAKALLPEPVGSVRGFIVCGEVEILVGTSDNPSGSALIYSRAADPVRALRGFQKRYSGDCGYWAPHQPANRGAIGTIHWAVGVRPGELEPVVVVWRVPGEPEVFAFDDYAEKLDIMHMESDNERTTLVEQRVAVVVPAEVSVEELFPARVPTGRPVQVPVR